MHRSSILAFLVIVLAASMFSVSPTATAEGRTVIVPDNYASIDAAIEAASDGDIIQVRNGVYDGPMNKTVVIDKSLSIVGQSKEHTIIRLHPAYREWWILTAVFFDYTNALTVTADNCVLQNLTVEVANPGGFIDCLGNRMLIYDCNLTVSPSTGITLAGQNSTITKSTIWGYVALNGSYNQADQNKASYFRVAGTNNIVKDNTCEGLSLSYTNSSVAVGNYVYSTTRGSSGVSLSWSNNNLVAKNTIKSFQYAFRFWYSDNNTIQANNAGDSLNAAVTFGASYNNTFYLNNFIDNPYWKTTGFFYDMYNDDNYVTAFPNMTTAVEVWSDGGFGNYWQDYQTNYPNASEIDNTGIGDILYIINQNNVDPYPLIRPYDIASATVTLPDWTNLDLPQALATPTFPPIPAQTPTVTPEPTITPTPAAAPKTQQPSQTTITPSQPKTSGLTFLIVIAALAVLISLIPLAAYYSRKSRSKKAAKPVTDYL